MTSLFRRVALSLAGTVALIVAADLTLRAIAPFPLHRDWEHPLIAAKERLYTTFAQREVDVLIVGSSLSMNLDAKRLSDATKRRVFNGSVAGLTAAGIAAVMAEAYAPTRKPRLVIYPLSMRDMRGGDAFAMPPFLSHKMREARPANWQSRLEVAVEDASYLFRVRRQLRHELVSNEQEEEIAPLDAHGTRNHTRHNLESRLKNKAYAKKNYEKLLRAKESSATTSNAEELVEMIEGNRRDGVQTVLVNMTISPAALQGELRSRYEKYLTDLERLANRADVPLYDALGDLKLSNAYFNDFVHVGAKGDKKVEDYLVPIILRHLDAK